MAVNQDKQFFYCFVCQESGNAIHFIRRYENLEFVDAIETLASAAGMTVPYENNRLEKSKPSGLVEKAVKFYQGNFRVQIKSIIDHMGNLIEADILQSSGNSMLDALALRILYQSAPFEPFPEDMVANYHQLEIVRDWNFTNS